MTMKYDPDLTKRHPVTLKYRDAPITIRGPVIDSVCDIMYREGVTFQLFPKECAINGDALEWAIAASCIANETDSSPNPERSMDLIIGINDGAAGVMLLIEIKENIKNPNSALNGKILEKRKGTTERITKENDIPIHQKAILIVPKDCYEQSKYRLDRLAMVNSEYKNFIAMDAEEFYNKCFV